jgi:hypothetical protein
MVDIFDEVSEDLRNERALALAKRYGVVLLAACLAVLVGVGVQQFWQWRQAQDAQKAAGAYLAVTGPIDANPAPDQAAKGAASLTNFAATAPAGYAALADLRAAALYSAAGQTGQALAIWNNVANSSVDPLLSDLAALLWAQHAAGTVPDDQVLTRLKPLEATGNPYHDLAQETQALIYLKQGHADLAKAIFTQIESDPAAAPDVRNRAQGLLASLSNG